MNIVPDAARARTFLQAIALGVIYYLLALPVANLQSPGTIAAIAWPAPAVAIAFLWRLPPRQWFVHLFAVFAAIIAVGIFDSLPWRNDVGFGALNVFEVVLCAWLGHRYVDRAGRLATTASLVHFLVLLPLTGIGLTSVLGATLASALTHTDWWREWRTLMVGNGVAVLVLVPALLAWLPAAPGATRPPRDPGRANLAAPVGSAAVVLVLAAGAWLPLSEELQRSALSLLLAATAIYGGLTGAAATVSIAAVLGVLLTLAHLGPYQYDGANSAWRLQVDMAGLAMLSFFVAVATHERRQLALRLERARRMESLGLLAGGVAHDFKNILCAVDGFAEIAEGHLDSASSARAPLRELQAASARGRDLTEQILLAARRGDRVRETLELASIAREAVTLSRPLCRAGVAIELELPDARLLVAAHRGQLVRAVLNLVRNACQAAHERVAVRIGSAHAATEPVSIGDMPAGVAAWVEVDDDGDGIPVDHLPHLFEPFFSTRAKGTGTGLGLAIVAGVACEHQGGVSVATSERGTRFRLLLPLAQAAADAHARADAHAPPQALENGAPNAASSPIQPAQPARPDAPVVPGARPGNGEAIMLIDSDARSRERTEDWLAELGFEPLGYADARLALERAAQADSDVCVLLADLDGPSAGAAEFATGLRERAPALPIIVCSAQPGIAAIAQAARAIALAKPFDRETLGRATTLAMKDLR